MAGSLRSTAELLQTIESNIIDEAEDFLPTRPDLVSRDQNNKVPQHKFGDPMTRFNLQQQLIFLVRKQNESCLHYIKRLKSLTTKINKKICSEIQNVEARNILISENELTAIQNLLANVSNELRILLIVKNPKNLDSAIHIITNYQILTTQNRFKNNFIQNLQPKHQNVNSTDNLFLKSDTPRHSRNRTTLPNQSVNIKPQPVITHFPPAHAGFEKNSPKPQPSYNKYQYPSGVGITPRQPQQSNPQCHYRNQPQYPNSQDLKDRHPQGQ
ncbi:uncharacterized protein LOC143202248 [Rhynchophorus ferrugineus]|uniref:uncharacterized protein LOC143202248 n=1 Tax=Rhynchophorus ferrugineus TaxID=354439 RepID=UPI003FCDFE4A